MQKKEGLYPPNKSKLINRSSCNNNPLINFRHVETIALCELKSIKEIGVNSAPKYDFQKIEHSKLIKHFHRN